MILFINACVREHSRTRVLADVLLERLVKSGDVVEEVRLSEVDFPVMDRETLHRRDALLEKGDREDPLVKLAVQFSRADEIVIAAPYWDLSFPASLKQYFEQVNCMGITFEYSDEGTPIPLCKAKRLIYVTTAGGAFVPEEFGFGYVKALAQGFYGIPDVRQVRAVRLDIVGADVDGIVAAAVDEIRAMEL